MLRRKKEVCIFMSNRTIKQKIWLSYIPPHRIQELIDDPKHEVFNNMMIVEDNQVKVLNPKSAETDPLYRVLIGKNSNKEKDEKFLSCLQDSQMDYNTRFKKHTGMTLEEYEAAHL